VRRGHSLSGLEFPAAMSGSRESVLELSGLVGEPVVVRTSDGREVMGTLQGYDQLLNLVLHECAETTVQEEGGKGRNLGTVVCRGTAVTSVMPAKTFGQIPNPFV